LPKVSRGQLADSTAAPKRRAYGQGGSLPRFKPMNILPWLAMSLMQKAIRRGRKGYEPEELAVAHEVSVALVEAYLYETPISSAGERG